MSKQTQKTKTNPNREKVIVALRVAVVAVLVAGIYVYGLPEVSWQEAVGSLSAVTLFVVVLKWVK